MAIIGAGAAGMVAAYELMRLGLKPVVYEAGRIGGRLRSQPFEGAEGVIAELGGMRFPAPPPPSSTTSIGSAWRPGRSPIRWSRPARVR